MFNGGGSAATLPDRVADSSRSLLGMGGGSRGFDGDLGADRVLGDPVLSHDWRHSRPLLPVLRAFSPLIVLVSCGFDAAAGASFGTPMMKGAR